MNRRPISPMARPLPRYSLPTAFAVCALLLWAGATLTSNFRLSGEPRLDSANPGKAAPRLFSSVSEIDFGTIKIGDSGTSRLVLTNSSLDDATITVSATWLSEPDALEFTSDFRGPRLLPAGDSLIIELRFTPVEAGHRVGALYVSHDGESNMDIFTLSGNGTNSDASLPALGGAMPAIKPAFGKSVLADISTVKPTSLQFGPDGRLYVADMLGLIKVFEIERDDVNDYRVVSEETINLIQNIPNHDDDGEPNTAIKKRLVTGLLVAGTASSPVVYVASSDPRIGGGPSHTETGLDTNSGVISRLMRSANGSWQKLDLVRGLSRSEENHHTNGMALDEATQRLYVTAGGNTNEGAPSNNFAMLPEYALSAAILEIDLGAIGESTYDLPTLDDETRSGTQDKNDPFGGNDGRNQARLVPGGPVQVYAPGFRNAYDLVLTDDGQLYTIDNGPNSGWGGPPSGEGSNGKCTNKQSESGSTSSDSLHLISERGYYGGHPNPTRANFSNTFNATKPQSPVSEANPIECELLSAGAGKALTTFPFSTNGLVEYRASNFGGAMQGDLLAAAWNNSIQRLVLDDSGSKLTDKSKLFANVGGLPLDVTAQGDAQHFPGTIWVADFVQKKIVVFEPVDYDGAAIGVCGDTPSTDDDNDGFSNADELANGTDPCSPADLPADLDGDFLSDRTDTDDDGDGIADQDDPFALDPNNGRATKLPVTYEWENDSESAGFLFNLGFSGLMNNGSSEYLDLYSLENLTTGGAAGVLTIDDIPDGDPIAGTNSQAYAFQFGIDVTPRTAPFLVHTRLLTPFAGTDIGGHQSMGVYIGTGDQDNYIKLVTTSAGLSGGVQFAAEREGTFQQVANVAAPVLGQSEVDLYLQLDPAAGTVRAFYRSGTAAEIVEVGSATALPKSWLEADSGLAVGIISTSFRGPTFGATWDFIRVTSGVTGTKTDEDTTDETGNSAGVGHIAVDGLIVIEAEDAVGNVAAASRSWVSGSRSGARGNASMITSPDSGLIRFGSGDSPHLSYQVDFPKAGSWHVWVRGWGDAVGNEGKSDSVHVGLDGTLAGAAALQGFPAGGWNWSNTVRGNGFATVQVNSPGQHTIDVWMREDGFEFDALVLSLDSGYVPSGTGPAGQQVTDADGGGNGDNTDTGSDDASDTGSDDGSETGGDNGTDTGSDDGTFTEGDDAINTGNDGDADTGGDNGTVTDSEEGAETGGDDAIDGLIVIEAEDAVGNVAAASRSWVSGSRSGARGNASMITSPDSGLIRFGSGDSPHLSYQVDFPKAGSWHVWVRGWGDAVGNEGKSDSVHVGLDGTLAGAAALQGFPAGGWNWSNTVRGNGFATVQVNSPGQHTIDVWMREDGFEFDALVLSLDSGYVPSGTGPAEQQVTDGDEGENGDNTDTGSDDGTVAGGDVAIDTGNDGGTDTGTDAGTGGEGGEGENTAVKHVVVFEAEAFASRSATASHAWTSGARGGSSGGSMVTTPDTGALNTGANGSPVMHYEVDFPTAGSWRVWVRGWGDAIGGEGKSDSVHVGLDGTLAGAAALQGFPSGGWVWSNSTRGNGFATVQVSSPGQHTIDVWMREDGLEIDALLLTTDADYVPSGVPGSGGSESESSEGSSDPGIENGDGSISSSRVSDTRDWVERASADGSSATKRHETGAVEFDGKLYLLGGRGNRPVDIYDPATDRWRKGAAAPFEMHHFQPVVLDGKIWVVGAMTCCYPRENNVSHVWTYTPASNLWEQGAEIPKARRRGSVATVVRDGKIYLVGGNTLGHDGGAVNWFDEFDPSSGTWRKLPDASAARDHAQGGLIDDWLVFAAGRRSTQPDVFSNTVARVDVYDFKSGTWSRGTDIPTLRAGTMAVTVGREVLVIGGESSGRTAAHNNVEAYDVDTDKWRELRPLKQGRHSGGAARLDDGVHVVAGATTKGGSNETASHESLTID